MAVHHDVVGAKLRVAATEGVHTHPHIGRARIVEAVEQRPHCLLHRSHLLCSEAVRRVEDQHHVSAGARRDGRRRTRIANDGIVAARAVDNTSYVR